MANKNLKSIETSAISPNPTGEAKIRGVAYNLGSPLMHKKKKTHTHKKDKDKWEHVVSASKDAGATDKGLFGNF